MSAQRLDRTLRCYRIGDPAGRHPIFDATGSTLYPGRWNTPSSPMIYAAEHSSTALLEKVVHGSGKIPSNQHSIEITVPRGATYEKLAIAHLPGWDASPATVSKSYGEKWCRERRSLILIVPSVVARVDHNILINPAHPEFASVTTGPNEPVYWDARLFRA